MNHRYFYAAAVSILWLTGCGQTDPGADATPREESAGAQHTGFGTVNSVDRAAARANVSHAAVASAGWPAMTMDFKLADPSVADRLQAGDRIEFRFTLEEGGTITAVEDLP